jgi:hypothetical protein
MKNFMPVSWPNPWLQRHGASRHSPFVRLNLPYKPGHGALSIRIWPRDAAHAFSA